MAKLTKEEIIASLKEMTVIELNDLVKAVEEEFGVTAAAPVAVAAAPAEEEAAAKGPSEVTLTLTSFGAQKVAVIKVYREITGVGLMEAKAECDITISIDCDGQDDISAMVDMVKAYLDGCEVVYGVRSNRSSDTFFKRFTAQSFYKFLNLMGAEVVYNHADYRLISSKVLDEFENFKEVNLFLRGMIPLVGFKNTSVYYERRERIAGESHYPLRKMLALAFDGITSLSVKPLHLITGLGVFVSILSFIGVIWAVITQLSGKTITGWASTVSIICFISGIQLICLGVIGEYIGKIYMEVKNRPRYIISERTSELERNTQSTKERAYKHE